MSNILITGTSGFIGSHFAKYFSEQGDTVWGLDQVKCPEHVLPFLKDVRQGLVGDKELIKNLLKEFKIDLVVHCAAKCLVEESVKFPQLYLENNVEQPKRMLEAMMDSGVHKLIFSSTCATFGKPREDTLSESHPQSPINPYGESKLLCEQLFKKYSSQGDLALGIFRYFNAAGADPDGKLGEDHQPETHLIPNALRAALGTNPAFKIYGNTFETRDGTCERDYIHVKDLASAHIQLAQRMIKHGHQGGEFNLGLGEGYTVLEVLDGIEQILQRKIPREFAAPRPGDPARLVANASKAKRELNWIPTHSDLKTIINHAYRWIARSK